MAIRKRGKGRWQVRVAAVPGGHSADEGSCRDGRARLEAAREARAPVPGEANQARRRAGRPAPTEADDGRQARSRSGPAGVRYYEDCVRPWEPLRNTPVPALRRRQVEDHIAARAAVAPTAARNELQFLKAALRAAQSRGQQVDVGIFEIDAIRVEPKEGEALEYDELLGLGVLAAGAGETDRALLRHRRPPLHRSGDAHRRPRRPRDRHDLHPCADQQEPAAEADPARTDRGSAPPRAAAGTSAGHARRLRNREGRRLQPLGLPVDLAAGAPRRWARA